jgi:hypothetical protein
MIRVIEGSTEKVDEKLQALHEDYRVEITHMQIRAGAMVVLALDLTPRVKNRY